MFYKLNLETIRTDKTSFTDDDDYDYGKLESVY